MIEFKINKDDLTRLVNTLCSIKPSKRGGAVTKAMTAGAAEVESYMKENILSGQVLKARTGALRSSISSRVIEQEKSITALIGSGVRSGRDATFNPASNRWDSSGRLPYANIQETGGVVRPRIAKYLAIPLSPALTAAGVLKKRPRDWDHTFVRRTSSGSLMIFRKSGAKGTGKIQALFVLKKSVTVPASRYMSLSAEAMQDKVVGIMMDSIKRQLEGSKI